MDSNKTLLWIYIDIKFFLYKYSLLFYKINQKNNNKIFYK